MQYYVQSMSFEGDGWYTWRTNQGRDLSVFDLPDARILARSLMADGADVVRLMPNEPDGVSLEDSRIEYYKREQCYNWLVEPPEPTHFMEVRFEGHHPVNVVISTVARFKEEQGLALQRDNGTFHMIDWRGREYRTPLKAERIKRLFQDAAQDSIRNAMYDSFKYVYPQRLGKTLNWRFFIISKGFGLQDWTVEFADLLGLPWSVDRGVRIGKNMDDVRPIIWGLLGSDVVIKEILNDN